MNDIACVAEDTLLAYASHTLEEARAAQVIAHVAVCSACRVVLASVARAEHTPGPVLKAPLHRGMSIGRYLLGDCVGVGGMGAVYEAHDPSLDRRVALKVLHEFRSDDAERAQRFGHERLILAGLEHPNIARLLDGGETADGRAFLVLEFVDGLPIDQYCARHRLSTTARLGLFRSVCEAVHYAHQNLVVHRDLKPSNILVSAEGVPKLVDFGIAKLLEGSSPPVTKTGRQPMTPAFASPEQVGHELPTTATDVYSLGVVLYQLLCGQGPYSLATDGLDELLRAVQTQEPQKPSAAAARTTPDAVLQREATLEKLQRRLRGDVDSIVLMALRKRPGDRYASAERMAEDLRCFLDGRPTSARRGTPLYRLALFTRRNKASVTAAAAAVVMLLGGGGTTLWQARVAQHERERAALEALEAARLGAEAEQMQELMRVEMLLPAHDLSPAYQRIRQLMAPLLDKPATVAPGPAAFTLGRGHQLLGDDLAAAKELKTAWDLGFHQPGVARALAQVEGRLYARELAVLGRIDDPKRKQARLDELAHRYREPAAARLESLGSAAIEADRLVMAARLALIEQHFKDAERLAEQAGRAGADPVETGLLEGEAQLLGGWDLFERGDPGAGAALATAGATLEQVVSIGRSAPAPLVLLARVRVMNYDLESRTAGFRLAALEPIVALLSAAQKLDPTGAEAHNVWAGVEKRRGDALAAAGGDSLAAYRAAVEQAERGLALSPFDPRIALLQLANTCHALALDLGDRGSDPLPTNARGLEAAEQAQRLSPDASGPLFNLTQLGAFLANWLDAHGEDARPAAARALAHARRFRELGDRPVTSLMVLARALEADAAARWAMGDDGDAQLAEGARVIQEAAEQAPKNWAVMEAGLSLAVTWATTALAEGRDPAQALRAGAPWAEALVPLTSSNLYFATDVGMLYLTQAQAEQTAGRDPSAWLDKAVPLLAGLAGKQSASRAALAEVGLIRAAWAVSRGGDPRPLLRRALEDARTAQKLDPKDASAWLLEGRALLEQPPAPAELARAQVAITQAIALNSRMATAWVAQARLKKALGDVPGAQAALERAARLQPRLASIGKLQATLRP